VPANLLFFVASMLLLAVSVQHSSELGRLEERTRTLAEEVGLLRLELSSLRPQQRRDEHPAGARAPRGHDADELVRQPSDSPPLRP
jgi:hypothetical protein